MQPVRPRLFLILFLLMPGILQATSRFAETCSGSPTFLAVETLRSRVADGRQRLARMDAEARSLFASLPQESPRAEPQALVGRAPYPATLDEILVVQREIERRGLPVPIEHTRMASRLWREGQLESERVAVVVAASTVLLKAGVDAIVSLIEYWARSQLFGEPFTCRGAGQAAVTGAVIGMLEDLKRLAWLLHLSESGIIANYLIPVVADAFFIEIDPHDWANSTISDFLTYVSDTLSDKLWAAMPCARAVVGAMCDLDDYAAGNFGVHRAWIEDELVPCAFSFLGPGIQSALQVLEAELTAQGADPEEAPGGTGSLELKRQGSTSNAVHLLTQQTIEWSAAVVVSQPGSYTVRLRLFRGGVFRGIAATAVTSAGTSPAMLHVGGSLQASQLFSTAGSVEGPHELRVELSNTTAGWTRDLETAAGQAVQASFDLRVNRPPGILMSTVGAEILLLNISLVVVDPDGTRPTSVVLTLDGVDENLTNLLPASGVDWTSGYRLSVNRSVAQGLHTLRARVSDGVHTSYSGPTETIRAAGFPYLQFPFVSLTEVGEPALYRVRVLDLLGGIPGADVYLSSNRSGFFHNSAADAAARVVTGTDGWASFYYTPLVTGQHVIQVLSDVTSPNAITQTSNTVQPACLAPESPLLLSPADARSDVGHAVELEWVSSEGAGAYDIHLGTSSPPPFLKSVSAETGFDQSTVVESLEAGRQYFWQVKAKAACDSSRKTPSVIRTFFTLTAPGGVILVKPENAATEQATGLLLDWQNVTTPGATLYDLYFGTTDPPPFHADMNTRTEALMTGLLANTTYFWKVVARSAKDPSLVSQSPTWRFTTGTVSSTTVTLTAVRDAGLRGGSFANRNYGGQTGGPAEQRLFGLGNWDGLYLDPGAAPIRGVVGFDLASIPAGSTIQNATMLLTPATFTGSQSQPLPIQIDPLTGPWTESSITWNNRPGLDTSRRVDAVFPLSGFNPLQLNITPLVQAWTGGVIPNQGVQIAISSWEGLSAHAKTFSQREDAASRAPQLTVTYTAPCPAPAAPGLPTPPDGITGVSSVGLDWADVPGAGSYKVYAGTSSPPPFVGIATSSSFELAGLLPGSQYWWRVEALAGCDAGTATTSPTWTFTTDACLQLAAPVPVTPVDGVGGQPRSIGLGWTAVPGASAYEVFLDSVNPPVRTAGSVTGTSLTLGGLLPQTTYSWRVRAVSSCNPAFSTDGPVASFVTALAPRAEAGPDRQILLGETVALGGDPPAVGGTPPYTYNWTSLSAGSSLDAPNVAHPVFAASSTGRHEAQLVVTDSFGFVSVPSRVAIDVLGRGLDFYTLPPCRVLDTREAAPLASGVASVLAVAGACGVPPTAKAISGNLTVFAPAASGNVAVFPGASPAPTTSTINFATGQTRANNLIVGLSEDGAGTLGLRATVSGAGTVHVILDLNGYFE